MTDMNYEDEETLRFADDVLMGITRELNLKASTSDLHPLQAEYIDDMLENTEGLVYWSDEDHQWAYNNPSLTQARQIAAAEE